MKENHPDKLVARGLPENMIKLAQEKVQQINVAYDAIKASRGIK
jgi:DnaJ like chaperone protein